MRYILSIAALLVLLPVAALADVKYYRFSVDTWGPGLPVYTGRVQSRTASSKVYEVETDARGRYSPAIDNCAKTAGSYLYIVTFENQ
jgi:hypothetical protein